MSAVPLAPKTLRVASANGDEKTITVMDTTTVREISLQLEEDDGQYRHATLLRGVTLLEPDMAVSEAGLEDGGVISLVWSDPFVEMARWTGQAMDQDLYVRIPPGTTRIYDEAFRDCEALVKIVIPNSVTSIGDGAFDGCRSLTEVKIPNSVTSIGQRAFAHCSSLTQVKIPNSVTVFFGAKAFAFCSSLREVEIPNSVTRLGTGAFDGCSSLTQVEIPNSVTSIADRAFADCRSLTEVEILNPTIRISDEAFAGCSSRIQRKTAELGPREIRLRNPRWQFPLAAVISRMKSVCARLLFFSCVTICLLLFVITAGFRQALKLLRLNDLFGKKNGRRPESLVEFGA